MIRGPAGTGEILGWGRREGEGNVASAFPVHLGTGEPVGLPGLILCPGASLLPCRAQASPRTPTQGPASAHGDPL